MGNWLHNGEIHHGSSRVSTAHDPIQAHLARRTIVLVVMGVTVAQELRELSAVQDFIVRYPGVPQSALGVTTGFPAWLRVQHFLA
jgi:hypothetical protein